MKRHAMTILVLLVLAAGSAVAEESEWTRSCRFTIEVDGKPAKDAAVFEKQRSADILGLLPGGTWFLVRPPKEVFEVPPEAVERRDEQLAVLRQEPSGDALPVTVTPSGLTFDVAGRWLRIILVPALLGSTTPEEFLSLCPEYQRREHDYSPKTESVEQIAATSRPLTLEIYFGSWCPHCQKVLPQLFKSLRLANNSKLEVRMIGLPRSFGQDPAVRAKHIRGVPTIIVMDQGGAEVGRFTGTEKTAVEETLAQLLGG